MEKNENNNQDKISIIVPIYNTGAYLSQCLDSLINQTYKHLEIICINNNSSDNCSSILNEYIKLDNRIKIFNNPIVNVGLTRNIGIKNATGNYLCFVDSDDYIDKTTIEKVYSTIKEHDSDICFYGYYKFDDNSHKVESNMYGIVKEKKMNNPFNVFTLENHDILTITNPGSCNKMFKSSFINDNRIYFPELTVAEDAYFTFSAFMLAKSITYLKEGLYYYRSREGSITHTVYSDPCCFCNALLLLKNKIKEIGYTEILKESYAKLVNDIYNFNFSLARKKLTDEEYYNKVDEYNSKYKDFLKL